MSRYRHLNQYFPAKKHNTSQSKANENKEDVPDNKELTDFERFRECKKQKFLMPPDNGFKPNMSYEKANLSSWIYPGSKGFRKYQFTICRTCLFANTLVCLPTGLGKTFIAATVLFNYYRWFTEGMVFFLAPTKPLVDQQYNAFVGTIPGFNLDHVGQLTGKQSKPQRSSLYKTARVFFMTPQTLANDLRRELLDKKKVTCIIFDEAHRATGNYAYCTIIKEMDEAEVGYRVVALSATPGSSIDSIQQIITNLHISRIEVRDEEDSDVKQYTHFKEIEVIKVKKTTEIDKLEKLMLKVLCIPQTYLQTQKLLPYTKSGAVNKMIILESQEKFKRDALEYEQIHGLSALSMAFCYFSSLLSLLSGLSMLLTHGIETLRIFCDKFKESAEEKKGRKSIVNSKEFKELSEYTNEIAKVKNHPKLEKMKEMLVSFFKEEGHKKSQVIVFTLFVNSAQEICKYLSDESTITSNIFIGQANGYTQKQQMQIINRFKAHDFNTLVATCIGEEGLDIGFVDLILSYDCTCSPVRMIQRFGRTGRKQEGKVIILLCDEEEKRYGKMKKQTKHIFDVLKSSSGNSSKAKSIFIFDPSNSRMIEDNLLPECVWATLEEDFMVTNKPKTGDEETKDKSTLKDLIEQDCIDLPEFSLGNIELSITKNETTSTSIKKLDSEEEAILNEVERDLQELELSKSEDKEGNAPDITTNKSTGKVKAKSAVTLRKDIEEEKVPLVETKENSEDSLLDDIPLELLNSQSISKHENNKLQATCNDEVTLAEDLKSEYLLEIAGELLSDEPPKRSNDKALVHPLKKYKFSS